MNLRNKLKTIKTKTNTQKAALTLLKSAGQWVPRSKVHVNFAAARIRDLRKKQYGGFKVECKSAVQLGRRTKVENMFYYRIPTSTVTQKKLNTVFS